MKKTLELLGPVATSTILALVLKYLGVLNLTPLGYWEPSVVNFLIVVSSLVGAIIASMFPKKNASYRNRAWWFGIVLLLAVASLITWNLVAPHPPEVDKKLQHSVICHVSYFGFYFLLGFLIAHIAQFAIGKAGSGDKKPPE
jgi:hypothetical protein